MVSDISGKDVGDATALDNLPSVFYDSSKFSNGPTLEKEEWNGSLVDRGCPDSKITGFHLFV
jgi:hypothetical protein